MKTITFAIKGMHCKSCVLLINDALSEDKGVQKSDVDLKKNTATILYDERLTNEKKLMQIIRTEGYEVTPAK